MFRNKKAVGILIFMLLGMILLITFIFAFGIVTYILASNVFVLLGVFLAVVGGVGMFM